MSLLFLEWSKSRENWKFYMNQILLLSDEKPFSYSSVFNKQNERVIDILKDVSSTSYIVNLI